jgi:hypothetical protein
LIDLIIGFKVLRTVRRFGGGVGGSKKALFLQRFGDWGCLKKALFLQIFGEWGFEESSLSSEV